MRRMLPSPLLSALLFAVWLLLNQSLDLVTLALGVLVAWAVPLATRSLRPAPVCMQRPGLLVRLLLRVAIDIVHSALTMTHLLLTRRSHQLLPRFVELPLQVRDPNALALLAMIICLTPGTMWAELSFDRSRLLMHLFHLPPEAEADFITEVKHNYERPLMAIFE
ncbi:MAG: Na+/H+ antiporter subunit E [Variovorax sp.]